MPLVSLSDICAVYQSVKENLYGVKLDPCGDDITCDKCWRFHQLLSRYDQYSEADQLFMLEKAIEQKERSICDSLALNDANLIHQFSNTRLSRSS